jgi:hypothetical protein
MKFNTQANRGNGIACFPIVRPAGVGQKIRRAAYEEPEHSQKMSTHQDD